MPQRSPADPRVGRIASQAAGTTIADRASRPAALFVAIALLLMGIFTMSWALWSLVGLPAEVGAAALTALGSLAVVYMIRGIQLVRSLANFPPAPPDELSRRGRPLQMGFGITFGTEGLVIGVVSGLLSAVGANAYLQPAIALCVGLHFIPFGVLFHRTIDYYVAGWVVTWAGVGIWLINSHTIPTVSAGALVALATACGTATYGLYLLHVKKLITSRINMLS